jgi:hypothetical protein
MAGAATGPIYGPIPDLNVVWATSNPQTGAALYTAEETRELLRESQKISAGYRELHKLSQAMNSTAVISSITVEKIQDFVIKWAALEIKIETLRSETPSEAGLPLIKADVVEYSIEPLKYKSLMQVKTQPLEEEQARLEIKICRALNLELWDLPQAPCCTDEVNGMTAIHRS